MSPYRVINNALSNRSKKTLLPLREYMFYLLMGLRNLPRFRKQSVLYRGIRMPKKVLLKTYYEGRTLFWTTFTSTSTDEEKALKFTSIIGNKEDPDECGVIFEIHGKFRGYSIGSLSKFATEEEILLEPDTKFTVMMVSQDEKDPDLMRVVLSVKDEEPILKEELGKFESCCEEIIIKEEYLKIGNNKNEKGRFSFNNQEQSSISTVAQGKGEVNPVKNEQQLGSFSMQSRGDVKATENEQSHSSIFNSQDKRDSMTFNKEVRQHSLPSISDVQSKGIISSFPTRGEIQKTTTGNKEQPSHPAPAPTATIKRSQFSYMKTNIAGIQDEKGNLSPSKDKIIFIYNDSSKNDIESQSIDINVNSVNSGSITLKGSVEKKWECAWKECPDYVDLGNKYSVDEKNPRIAIKTDNNYSYSTVVGDTPLPPNEVTSWSIKILKLKCNDRRGIFIWVLPFDINQYEHGNYKNCGWYFNCLSSSLRSGPPHKYDGKKYGPRKEDGKYIHTGDCVGVVMDTTKGELSFALNGVNYGVAYKGIPLDKPLVPCAILYHKGDSVELVI